MIRMNKLSDVLKKLYNNNKKQMTVLIIAVIMLVVISILTSSEDVKSEINDNTDTVYSLEYELEKKLEDFLSVVDGVGKVKVCVTFDILEQTSFAQNTETDTDEKGKEIKTDYVIIDTENGEEKGLEISVRAPEIRGVAIACEGGASATVRNEITSLVCSVLGISSNRVFVSQYKKSK